MPSRFGWCAAPDGAIPDHKNCPEIIGGPDGIACGCVCHAEDHAAVRVSPSGAERTRENETRPQGASTPAASDHQPGLAGRG